jgi:4-alpha-glucanotransferase
MDGFSDFCQENQFWLPDYALYRVLRQVHGKPWQDWPWRERDRKNLKTLQKKYAAEIQAVMEEQYRFFAQWSQVRAKAQALGVALIGDLPIYAALDSAETWAHREEFLLDSTGHPTLRSGCPPDYFAPEGQDWGNPLYNWAKMEENGYSWWKQRLRQAFSCYDQVRLDHFRSFAAYYAIPAGKSAKEGHWMKGAGVRFFREMAKEFGCLPIVAEDLGALDSQVTVLLRHTGLAGMNVWQFSAQDMAAMPPEIAKNRVFFSGTHDNQTLRSFLQDTGDRRSVQEVLTELENSSATAVIFPVQDVLNLDDRARINVPGVPTGNWTWRMTQEQLQSLGK